MRALLLILDGIGIGTLPDLPACKDPVDSPLGRLFRHRSHLELPHLFSLGLREILTGTEIHPIRTRACYGRIKAATLNKELISAHWEIAGVDVKEPLITQSTHFLTPLLKAIETEAGIELIGNCPGKSPAILEKFGAIHLKTGRPILYMPSYAVMQIAAHEKMIPRKRLYEICRIARRHCPTFGISRVIARPFTGQPGNFILSENGRFEFPIMPPRTVLNALSETGLAVECVGKIAHNFGSSGVTGTHPATSNKEGMKVIKKIWGLMQDGLIFAHLPDFERSRNLSEFAMALTEFDDWLGHFLSQVDSEDLVIITASHGHDPSFQQQERNREDLPIFAMTGKKCGPLEGDAIFADITATLLAYFDLKEKWPHGKSLFSFERTPSFYY